MRLRRLPLRGAIPAARQSRFRGILALAAPVSCVAGHAIR